MSKELKRNLGETNLSIRLFTISDKKSPMFRARYDDVHVIEVNARGEGHNVQLLQREFADYKVAKQWYELYLNAFGHSLMAIRRKRSP